jgi:hypothetical protein
MKLNIRSAVNLKNNGFSKTYYIHRLIMLAFNIPNPENKEEVDHIDSNPANNKLSNLRWATHTENMNNINTIIKKTRKIKITFKDKHEEIVHGAASVAKILGISESYMSTILGKNKQYNGHIFTILE